MTIQPPENEKAAPEDGSSCLGTHHGVGYAVIVDKRVKPKPLLERGGEGTNLGSLLSPDRRGAAARVDLREWRDRALNRRSDPAQCCVCIGPLSALMVHAILAVTHRLRAPPSCA